MALGDGINPSSAWDSNTGSEGDVSPSWGVYEGAWPLCAHDRGVAARQRRCPHREAVAFSLSARRNLTMAIVSLAQYWRSASLILACSIQSSSMNTMR